MIHIGHNSMRSRNNNSRRSYLPMPCRSRILAAPPFLLSQPSRLSISVAVRDLAEVSACVPALADVGYVEVPINPRFQRRLFCKGPYNEGTHHLHFSVHASAVWAEPLLFRDYLRAHPGAAAWYQQVKRASASKHQHDLNGYHDEKARCVGTLMEQATRVAGKREGSIDALECLTAQPAVAADRCAPRSLGFERAHWRRACGS